MLPASFSRFSPYTYTSGKVQGRAQVPGPQVLSGGAGGVHATATSAVTAEVRRGAGCPSLRFAKTRSRRGLVFHDSHFSVFECGCAFSCLPFLG